MSLGSEGREREREACERAPRIQSSQVSYPSLLYDAVISIGFLILGGVTLILSWNITTLLSNLFAIEVEQPGYCREDEGEQS